MADAHGAKGHGIRTVVDPGAMFLHRDAAFSKRVADEAGIQVVLATGVYTYDHLPQGLLSRDEDALAEIFVYEIENGIQGTGIKPAFIKCAADEPGVTPNVEKVHRAAAREQPDGQADHGPLTAGERDGPGADAHLRRGGVDPTKIQIAHTGDTDDLEYIETLLETGCWIGLDRYGIDIYLPTPNRNATTLALLERGYADPCSSPRTTARRSTGSRAEVQEYLKANEVPDWSMTFLFDKVIPELKERSLTDEQLDQMKWSTTPSAGWAPEFAD